MRKFLKYSACSETDTDNKIPDGLLKAIRAYQKAQHYNYKDDKDTSTPFTALSRKKMLVSLLKTDTNGLFLNYLKQWQNPTLEITPERLDNDLAKIPFLYRFLSCNPITGLPLNALNATKNHEKVRLILEKTIRAYHFEYMAKNVLLLRKNAKHGTFTPQTLDRNNVFTTALKHRIQRYCKDFIVQSLTNHEFKVKWDCHSKFTNLEIVSNQSHCFLSNQKTLAHSVTLTLTPYWVKNVYQNGFMFLADTGMFTLHAEPVAKDQQGTLFLLTVLIGTVRSKKKRTAYSQVYVYRYNNGEQVIPNTFNLRQFCKINGIEPRKQIEPFNNKSLLLTHEIPQSRLP